MVWRNIFKIVILVFVISGLCVPDVFVSALTPQQEREALEQELERLEQEIKQYEEDIAVTQQEKKTLQNQIYILQNKIRKLDLQISQSNMLIEDLRVQIDDTTTSISKTEAEIDEVKMQLGEILQRIYEEDRKTKLEVLLVGDQLSDFFDNLVALDAINVSNKELLSDVQDLNAYLQSQKQALESEKGDEENLVRISILQKEQSKSAQSESEDLLEITKGKESQYQQLLEDRQESAAKIRSRIFALIGVPEAPTFGEALEIAKVVSKSTGVRPAFLLAVLTQESNLGKNVGQCYLTDPVTGAGRVAYNGQAISKVMKPTRDVQPFLTITQELGRDPYNTPVSCPIASVGGYGGAMGPAQFIPSTWMGYRDRLKSIKGSPGDPWNITDAFLAAALYLSDYGAAKQTYNDEWRSAMAYFAGPNWSWRYRFYGDSVMAITAQYEEDIKTLGE